MTTCHHYRRQQHCAMIYLFLLYLKAVFTDWEVSRIIWLVSVIRPEGFQDFIFSYFVRFFPSLVTHAPCSAPTGLTQTDGHVKTTSSCARALPTSLPKALIQIMRVDKLTHNWCHGDVKPVQSCRILLKANFMSLCFLGL